MSHEHANNPAFDELKTVEPNRLDMRLMALAGFIGTVLILALILATQAWYYQAIDSEHSKKNSGMANFHITQLKAEQMGRIGAYRWVDQNGGKVMIPIDEAMRQTVTAAEAGPQ